jgi:acylphosphatase
MMMTLHAVVRGRVQGIGFRWFVRERARALGLVGWVRNRNDGSVEVLAAGNATEIATLAGALERGPDGAQVQAVERLAEAVGSDPLPDPFTIER